MKVILEGDSGTLTVEDYATKRRVYIEVLLRGEENPQGMTVLVSELRRALDACVPFSCSDDD